MHWLRLDHGLVVFSALTYATACENACQDVCLTVPGCPSGGSHCKDYLPPPHVCQDLFIEKTNIQGGAAVCSHRSGKCSDEYPLRCQDISPFHSHSPPKYPIKAKSVLEHHGSNSTASGTFYYTQYSANKTVIEYEITGLAPHTVHGIHIHETAVFTPRGCVSAGGHYNPFYYEHGGHDANLRHVGDMGNVKADGNGVARGSITSNLIQLHGQFSVMHRSSMLHADEDDLGQGGFPDSKTTGHAGARLACGEILPA
ncbi:Superoxide dismutase [Cu-Zn] [Perkinsus chesapeaki]|uniref:Superoxide dismutase [Cu-Zn] n=1 Tax=Perkinsus chesapeaki TaxID=330153 RepID=A0A7J6MXH3_PERCH|nr:Superoxide dismutase [Cu-Zn] [Perkinsus chesapeaki]